ncbi:MAG: hypothetical protein ACFE0Q_11655 [Anaerolineae bacterium]
MDFNQIVMRFSFFDMPVRVQRSAQLGVIIMLVICTALALYFTDLTLLDSLVAGVLATLIFWLSDLVHQYGHFFIAKRIGKPSTGLTLWWVLGSTTYPRDEGRLTPQTHIKRASGGPIASVLFVLLWGSVALAFWSVGGMLQFLIGWALYVQIIVFTLGALTPITMGGFNSDGAIILQSWRNLRK